MIKNICFIFLLSLLSLSGISQNSKTHLEMLKNAPVIETKVYENYGEFSTTTCRFKDIDTVYYSYYNQPPVHGNLEVISQIDSVVLETFELANKVAIQRSKFPDVVILFEYLDGKGGTLAKATLPNCSNTVVQKLVFDNYDVPPGFNTPDSIKVLYTNIKDIKTLTKHELGHILGFGHNGLKSSMLYPIYDGPKEWSRLDSLGFKLLFGLNDFTYIAGNDYSNLTKNFTVNEFYTKCEVKASHFLHNDVIIAIQQIRDYYNTPIVVTSTYRHKECNTIAGGSSKSQHLAGRALDFKFVDHAVHVDFLQDVLNKKSIYNILKNNRITAIGLYDSHIHIDARPSDDSLIIWDKTGAMSDSEGCDL